MKWYEMGWNDRTGSEAESRAGILGHPIPENRGEVRLCRERKQKIILTSKYVSEECS